MNALETYKHEKLSAVVRTDEKAYSLEIARAIIEGGIKIIEITVENPDMYEVVKELRSTTNALIVAGGVITARQAQNAIIAGAQAIVSPIFQPNLVRLCQAKGVPLITTATTPNEAYQAWKAGVSLIKIFPSQQMGGAVYIHDLLRPMPFLNVIATGNVMVDDFCEYLKAGASAVTIGRDLWQESTPAEITAKTKIAVEKLKTF